MSRFFRSALFPLIVIVLLVYLASQTLLPRSQEAQKITYSKLIDIVETSPSTIEQVLFVPKGRSIEATMRDGTKYKVNYPTDESQFQFQQDLENTVPPINFDSKGTGDSAWWSILTYILPFLLFFGFWIFLMRQVRSGKDKKDDAVSGTESERSF